MRRRKYALVKHLISAQFSATYFICIAPLNNFLQGWSYYHISRGRKARLQNIKPRLSHMAEQHQKQTWRPGSKAESQLLLPSPALIAQARHLVERPQTSAIVFEWEVPAPLLALESPWSSEEAPLSLPSPLQEHQGLGFGWLCRALSSHHGNMVLSSCSTGEATKEINGISAQ